MSLLVMKIKFVIDVEAKNIHKRDKEVQKCVREKEAGCGEKCN